MSLLSPLINLMHPYQIKVFVFLKEIIPILNGFERYTVVLHYYHSVYFKSGSEKTLETYEQKSMKRKEQPSVVLDMHVCRRMYRQHVHT